MKFDLMQTIGNNTVFLVGGISFGVAFALIVILIPFLNLDNISFRRVAVAVFGFIAIASGGLALSQEQVQKFDGDKTISQIEDMGLTVVSQGDYIFSPLHSSFGTSWESVDNKEYISDHALELRNEDGLSYSCKTTVPDRNDENIFYVDCLVPDSDSSEYVPLDKALETSS